MNKLNFMNSIQVPVPNKSVFDLTHDVKMSCNMGWLIPSMVFDVVPGDKVNISTEALVRFAPLATPVFNRFKVTFHTWAVPYRILWPAWSDYITENPDLPARPAFPYLPIDHTTYTELCDYLGIPKPSLPNLGQIEELSAMRFAAYQCVYNEFYRDQNLIDPVPYQLLDGDNFGNITELTQMRKRSWMHDYFTSNLPFAQKGEAVRVPVQLDNAPVRHNRAHNPGDETSWVGNVSSGGTTTVEVDDKVDTNIESQQLFADNENASSITTLNEFRLANVLQRYLERAARSGTRLVEWIKGMFSETLPDYTAQRPQYIGGSISPIQISEVLNTTGIDGELPQGNMSGRGIGVNQGKQGTYYAKEHCVIITMFNVQPETSYTQGLEREWKKIHSPKDFLNPMFQHLGEQETLVSEVMAFSPASTGSFGYLPKYSEYRTIPNRVAGQFRDVLSDWTAARIFDPVTPPVLNQEFIECTPTHRIFADTDPDAHKLYVHVLNRVRAVRPLSKMGTPAL